jgi:hypothetical protein
MATILRGVKPSGWRHNEEECDGKGNFWFFKALRY